MLFQQPINQAIIAVISSTIYIMVLVVILLARVTKDNLGVT